MIAANTAEVVQLTIGAVLGVAVSFNLDRFHLSGWKAAGIVAVFLFTFLVLSDLLIN